MSFWAGAWLHLSAALHLFGCLAFARLPCTCSAALHLFGCPALIRLPGARPRPWRFGDGGAGGALDGHRGLLMVTKVIVGCRSKRVSGPKLAGLVY